MTVRLATGAAIYAIGMALTVFAKVPLPIELAFLIVSYVILGGDVVWQAVRNISKGRVFDEHFLMSVSTIGAFVIGEYPEAVAVMLFYQVGEFFSHWLLSVQKIYIRLNGYTSRFCYSKKKWGIDYHISRKCLHW